MKIYLSLVLSVPYRSYSETHAGGIKKFWMVRTLFFFYIHTYIDINKVTYFFYNYEDIKDYFL